MMLTTAGELVCDCPECIDRGKIGAIRYDILGPFYKRGRARRWIVMRTTFAVKHDRRTVTGQALRRYDVANMPTKNKAQALARSLNAAIATCEHGTPDPRGTAWLCTGHERKATQ